MIDTTVLAYIFCFFTAVIVILQLALALGAPWGEMAMGGKFPGRFPPKMRVAAIIQLVLLLLVALIVLVRAELVFGEYFEISRSAVWFVVALFVVSSILNIITPSKKERMMGAPIAIILLTCSLIVARS
jgi:hypothetical protein